MLEHFFLEAKLNPENLTKLKQFAIQAAIKLLKDAEVEGVTLPQKVVDLEQISFGSIVAELRANRGVSLRTLSQDSGVSAVFIGRVEKNESSPTEGVMLELAHSLGIRLFAVYGDSQ